VTSRAADGSVEGVGREGRERGRGGEESGEEGRGRGQGEGGGRGGEEGTTAESEGGSRSGRWVFSGRGAEKRGADGGPDHCKGALVSGDRRQVALPRPQQRRSFDDALPALASSPHQPPGPHQGPSTPLETAGAGQPPFVARGDSRGHGTRHWCQERACRKAGERPALDLWGC